MSEIHCTEAVLESLHAKVVVLTGWSTTTLGKHAYTSDVKAEHKVLVPPQSSSSNELVRMSSSEIGLQRRAKTSRKT